MRILEQVIQEETFDIEVQYCDPDECLHDCIHSGTNNCDAIITGWRQKEAIMKEMEKVVQEIGFNCNFPLPNTTFSLYSGKTYFMCMPPLNL